MTATVCGVHTMSYTAALDADNLPSDPKWAQILGAQKYAFAYNLGDGSAGWKTVWEASVSAVVPLVQTLWATDTTLIRQEDWGWLNPPEGLAENLLATQSWLPWEGQADLAVDDIPDGNAVGCTLNVTGWLPETSSMYGLISGYSVTPATGQVSYVLGPPPRQAYRDLVNRFRQGGADNIYWISGGDDGNDNPVFDDPPIVLPEPVGDVLTFNGLFLTCNSYPVLFTNS
ncbi:MAG: hypothetical protein QM680_10690 [Luteolibacter sp.]